MQKFTNPLDNIRIASPCSADWNEMIGDERKRFCGQCKLNVYNLSNMTQREAEDFLLDSEDRVCVRFYRRKDGTVLTQDCPVGWRAIKGRVSRAATAAVSACVGIFAGLFAFNQSKTETDLSNAVRAIPVESVAPPTLLPEDAEIRSKGSVSMGKPEIRDLEIDGLSVVVAEGMPVNLDSVRTEIKKKRRR